ncbi:het domain-containing protein [Colletotrichum kahawae]|uniref:Het domain-containing protein n=1 Tax=Colletotrichum kahawae TaxID=34407 RepID=A0AAD9YAG7_COLKA|nr:het domain-containing protein [Colletotrichum kahawae]
MGSMVSSIENQQIPSQPLLGPSPLAFKPVLLSALLKWCERVENDAGQVWHRGCKKSLVDEEFWAREMRDGCPFCTLLFEAVWKLYGDYLTEGRCLKWTVPYPRRPEAIRDDGGNSIYFCIPDDGDLALRLRRFPNLWRGKGPSGDMKPILRNTASEETLQTIRGWINECTSTHPLCSKADVAKLPTRVIDVGSGEDDIRLHETGQSIGVYACLSHPWGKRPLVRTLKDNFSQFKCGIPWSTLPRTFQDAIDFARRLGLQYIWIDSLCIIQDDPLDWQKEAAQMANIYQHAYVTLAASKATDSSRGLYTSSSDPKYQAQQLSLVNDVDDTDFPLQVCSDLIHIDGFFDFFPISRRAWVYQERLLSARVVHFAGAEVNWECNSARNCECGQISAGASVLPDKIHFAGSLAELNGKFKGKDRELAEAASDSSDMKPDYSKFSISLLQSPQWGQSVKAWRQAVKQYAQLNLTFSKDRFPALAGIAKMWNPQYQDQYFAGLWRDSIHLDLLWLVYKPGRRPDECRAPTWSWASLEHEHQEFLRFDSDADCLNSGKGMPVQIIRITDFGLQTGKCPEMACLVIREKGSAMAGEVEYERVGTSFSLVITWASAVCVSASVCLVGTLSIFSMIATANPGFVYHPWMGFIGFQSINILASGFNLFERLLPWVSKTLLLYTCSMVFAVFVALLAGRSEKQTAHSFFAEIYNVSGWPDGVAFLIGLSPTNWAFSCLDAVVHLTDEIPQPRKNIPMALLCTAALGTFTGLPIVFALFFSATDLPAIAASTTPSLELFYQVYNSKTVAVVLQSLVTLSAAGAMIGCHTWQSRMAWAFSKDRAFPFHRHMSKIAPKPFNVPIWAHVWSCFWVALPGCLYLASNLAFNSLISAGILLQYITYSMGILCLLWTDRSKVVHGPFWFPKLGYVANMITLAWTLISGAFYSFPYYLPVTTEEMNYVSCVLVRVIFCAMGYWIAIGRVEYTMPLLG